MIIHYLKGGLGNQLFQIFATIALAIRLGKTFVFDTSTKTANGCTYRTTYWESLFKHIHDVLPNIEWKWVNSKLWHVPISTSKLHIMTEGGHHYKSIDHVFDREYNDQEDLFILEHYFQSYKYFQNEVQEIIDIFKFRELRNNLAITFPDMETSIAMHFRLGDYLKLLNVHPILQVEYYIDSLKHIRDCDDQVNNVYMFFQKEDLYLVEPMIMKLRETFPQYSFIWVEEETKGLSDWEELLLMSLCKHIIIANSTFSLWSAYLARYCSLGATARNVYYPSLWFGVDMMHCNVNDMFYPDWIKIETTNIYTKKT